MTRIDENQFATKSHNPNFLILDYDDRGHKFSFENVGTTLQGRKKGSRTFFEDWDFSDRSMNRHIDLDHLTSSMQSKDQSAKPEETGANSAYNGSTVD